MSHSTRQQELTDALAAAEAAHVAAVAAAHAAVAAAAMHGQAAVVATALATVAIDALTEARVVRAQTRWLGDHLRILKIHLNETVGYRPLEIDVVLFGMLRGERAVPAFAPYSNNNNNADDDAQYKAAFLELARAYLLEDRQQLIRDFDIEWRQGAAARATRRSERLRLLLHDRSSAGAAAEPPHKRQR